MVAAARLCKFTDDFLLKSADRQSVLIDADLAGIKMQRSEICLDIGPQRFENILSLVPTRPAADSQVMGLHELG